MSAAQVLDKPLDPTLKALKVMPADGRVLQDDLAVRFTTNQIAVTLGQVDEAAFGDHL